MHIIFISFFIFMLLCASGLAMMFFHKRMSAHYYNDETAATVRLIANLFVVMTSLVFGLMMNSSKNTYEAIDKSVHSFATDIIVLDRTMRNYGQETEKAQIQLEEYVVESIKNPTRGSDNPEGKADITGELLEKLGKTLAMIEPTNNYKDSTLLDIRQQYHSILQQRWALIEQSEGSIPLPIIAMLTAWLTLIFASYGYRAPCNAVTITMITSSAALIAASLYLILDMNIPFSGPIRISDMSLQRALMEIKS